MLPTFEVLGEWLVVSKLQRFGRGVRVGDVVAYNIPINDEVGVKRVLGLAGDYVLMDPPADEGFGGGGGGGGGMIQVRFHFECLPACLPVDLALDALVD
jgi:inner membrane protease subunit 1